jgi:hypothetical protein
MGPIIRTSFSFRANARLQYKKFKNGNFVVRLAKTSYYILPPFQNKRTSLTTTRMPMHDLITNIFNSLLVEIIKIGYFENTHQNKSNKILFAYIYILLKKYGQSMISE